MFLLPRLRLLFPISSVSVFSFSLLLPTRREKSRTFSREPGSGPAWPICGLGTSCTSSNSSSSEMQGCMHSLTFLLVSRNAACQI